MSSNTFKTLPKNLYHFRHKILQWFCLMLAISSIVIILSLFMFGWVGSLSNFFSGIWLPWARYPFKKTTIILLLLLLLAIIKVYTSCIKVYTSWKSRKRKCLMQATSNCCYKQTNILIKDVFNKIENNLENFLNNYSKLKSSAYDESSRTLCIDGAWGSGKTTFINNVESLCQTDGSRKKIIKVNLFQYDISRNPTSRVLEAVIGELFPKDVSKKLLKDIRDLKIDNLTLALPFSFSLGFKKHTISVEENILKIKETIRKEIKTDFIVIFDEIDRCKPEFAIHFLEVVKHLFNIQKLSFIFSCNKTQLENSINGLYGSDFNSSIYLNRFFSQTIVLRWDDANKLEFCSKFFDKKDDQRVAHEIWSWYTCLTVRDIIEVKNKLCITSKHDDTSTPFRICYYLLVQIEKYGETPFSSVDVDFAQNLDKAIVRRLNTDGEFQEKTYKLGRSIIGEITKDFLNNRTEQPLVERPSQSDWRISPV